MKVIEKIIPIVVIQNSCVGIGGFQFPEYKNGTYRRRDDKERTMLGIEI